MENIRNHRIGSIRWYADALGKTKAVIARIVKKHGKNYLKELYQKKYNAPIPVDNITIVETIVEPVEPVVPAVKRNESQETRVLENEILRYSAKNTLTEEDYENAHVFAMNEQKNFLIKGSLFLREWLDTPRHELSFIENDKAKIVLKYMDASNKNTKNRDDFVRGYSIKYETYLNKEHEDGSIFFRVDKLKEKIANDKKEEKKKNIEIFEERQKEMAKEGKEPSDYFYTGVIKDQFLEWKKERTEIAEKRKG